MTLNELLVMKRSLQNDIRIGIDTEDTWFDLDAVMFNIRLIHKENRNE